MSYSDMVSYITTLMAITLSPGPITMILIARSASKDLSGAFFFGLGFALGGVMIISLVCFCFGAWLTDIPGFLKYSKYLMVAYILWFAYGVWKGAGFNTNR